MEPPSIRAELQRAHGQGCTEALICIGDTPETAFPMYQRWLVDRGFGSTVDFLVASAHDALAAGLLPHTNAGVLDGESLQRLKVVNVSQGLMLESVSARLCEAGGPHRHAPDKRPEVRLAMLDEAGRRGIAMTTGILMGIGETPVERVEALLAIRELHRKYGHIQEVIVQNFRAGEHTPMAGVPEPSPAEVERTVALARLILDPEVSVQAPPNLNPGGIEGLLEAGINDLGGISPVTPDFVNPGHPWPELQALSRRLSDRGFRLRPRLPIYPRWAQAPFLDPELVPALNLAQRQLESAAWFA